MSVNVVYRESWAIVAPQPDVQLDELPDEIFLTIFRELNRAQLFCCAFVCRRWRRIVMEPALLGHVNYLLFRYPQLQIIDRDFWESNVDISHYGLSFEHTPPLDWRALDRILFRLFNRVVPFKKKRFRKYPTKNPGVLNNMGATLITIPKGMTFRKMWEIAMNSSRSIDASYSPPEILSVNPETYQVLITNDVFNHTREMKRAKSLQFLKCMGMTIPDPLSLYCMIGARNIKFAINHVPKSIPRETKKIHVRSQGKDSKVCLVICGNDRSKLPVYLVSFAPFKWANFGPMGMVRLE